MKNILYFCFAFFILLLLSYKLYYEPEIKNLTNQIYLNKSLEIKELLKEEIKNKKKRTFALTYLISQDKKIIYALENKLNKSAEGTPLLDILNEALLTVNSEGERCSADEVIEEVMNSFGTDSEEYDNVVVIASRLNLI